MIDPIDGTKEYIAGKDEYTLNAALVIDTVPVIGVVGVPKKNRLFYTYGPGESYLIENGKSKKINCEKQQPKGKVVALSSVLTPSDVILNKLKVEASNRGLAVEFIEEIWTLMIKNFIKYEEKIFDEIHKK